MPQCEQLLTYDDVAEILRISYASVSRKVCRGEIEVVKLGSQTKRIRPAALEAYIRNRTSTENAPSGVPSSVRQPREKTVKTRLLSYTVKPLNPLK